jgi:uncharacterized membrane protein
MKISPKRHIGKTISYRILSSGTGFTIMYFATGSIKFSTAFSLTELALKPFLYYLHERFWYKYIKYGIKKQHPIGY